MAETSAALPIKSAAVVPEDPKHPLADKLPKLKLGWDYVKWLGALQTTVDAKPERKWHLVPLTGQAASIATTPIGVTPTAGIWRISTTWRVTTAGSVSSSMQVTISWTERGVAQSESGVASIGNLTTTRKGETFIIRSDGATPISYSTTYADGGGAQHMIYSLDIVAELLSSD